MRLMKTLSLLALVFAAPAAAQEQDTSATTEQARASVVQHHVDAYRAGNMDAFLRTFASDAVLVYGGMEFQGHAEIRHAYSMNFGPNAPKIKVLASGSTDDVIWMETAYQFANGEELCCGYSEYTVKNGKIALLVVSGP